MTKLLTIAVSVAMVVSPALNVFASAQGETDQKAHIVQSGTYDGVNYTYGTIDAAKTGSISIYKYEENDGKMSEGSGMKDASATRDGARKPIQGIVFKGLKIADVKTLSGYETASDEQNPDAAAAKSAVSGTYYTNVNSKFTDLLKQYGITLASANLQDQNGKEIPDVHTAKQMEAALGALNDAQSLNNDTEVTGAEAIASLLNAADSGAVAFDATDKDGHTSKKDLPLGLYLIAETDAKASAALGNGTLTTPGSQHVAGDTTQNHQDVESTTAPYLVSVPMTNVIDFEDGGTTVKAGTAFIYDIVSYPKNQTTNVVKKIVGPDTDGSKAKHNLEDYEDYAIGDVVKQVIYADAPSNMRLTGSDRAAQNSNNYTVFAVSDEMQPGMKLVNYGESTTNKNTANPDNLAVYLTDKGADPATSSDLTGAKNAVKLTRASLGEGGALTDGDYVVLKTPAAVSGIAANADLNTVYSTVDSTLAKALASVPTNTDAQAFCVQLTSKGLQKINAEGANRRLSVFFDSEVTPSAKIGVEDKNTNQALLTIKHQQSKTFEKYSNETRVFTYGIDLTKKQEDAQDSFDPSQSIFTVKKSAHVNDGFATTDETAGAQENVVQADNAKAASKDNTGSQAEADYLKKMDTASETDWDDTGLVRFVQEEEGVYHVYASDTDDAKNATTMVSPAKSGKLYLKGLDSAEYTVTERHTQDHFSLMKDSFNVDLKAATTEDSGNKVSDYDETAGKAVNGINVSRQALAGELTAHKNGSLNAKDAVSIKNGDETTTLDLSLDKNNAGIGQLTVMNDKVVTLRTGGKGMYVFYFAGAGVAAAVIVLGYAYSRKKHNKEA